MNKQILTKEFTLAEVLSAISGYLLDGKFDRIHELIEWVVGNSVFTHQIPYVIDYVKTTLVKQFPQLNPDTDKLLAREIKWITDSLKSEDTDTVLRIREMWLARFGNTFQVAPMQPFDEFEQPPLITPNIEGKVLLTVNASGEEFPSSL